MERKQSEGYIVSTDEAQGLVESVWAVMGNVDDGGDIIHNGAFTKTFAERGQSVALLDNHQTDSIMRSLGHVLALRELGRESLPPAVLAKCPEATGAAWGQFKFLLDTPEGKGAFIRLKSGAVGQWSFGYDTLDMDYSKVAQKDGQEITVRNLRTLKLYEISPVLFAMNAATGTLDAKAAPGSEAKPWDIFKEGDKWRIYKVDTNGKPTGDPLGKHDTEEEAMAQMRALYASESAAGKAAVLFGDCLAEERAKRDLNDRRWQMDLALIDSIGSIMRDPLLDDAGRRIALITSLTQFSDAILAWATEAQQAGIFEEDDDGKIKSGRVIARRNAERISKIREILAELEKEAGLSDEEEGKGAPVGAAPVNSNQSEAGPVTPPTEIDVVSLINEIEELELTLLEV